jgi:hypothetical protein
LREIGRKTRAFFESAAIITHSIQTGNHDKYGESESNRSGRKPTAVSEA